MGELNQAVIGEFRANRGKVSGPMEGVANPMVTVEVGTEKFKARATQVSGVERQRLFEAQAQLMPFFTDYQKKTKRQIPVLTLTRID
jgi:hypothetical protein